MAFCSSCGNSLLSTHKFCPKCGKSVAEPTTARKPVPVYFIVSITLIVIIVALVYLLPIFTDKKGNATTSDSLPATPAVSTLQPDGKLNFVTDTYVIVTGSFKQMENVQAEIQSLRGRGEQAGYFWRPDFPALEGWALYSTFVGLYDSYAACESKLRDLKRFNANYYGLKLSRDSKKVMIH